MKKFIFSILPLFFMSVLMAQNLVPNASFESLSSCPCNTCTGNIGNATGWAGPTPATCGDLFNTCVVSAPALEGVPANGFGNQSPNTGNGYAGISTYCETGLYREYIMSTLSSALVAGTSYDIIFHASLGDLYRDGIKELGAYLSPSIPTPGVGGLITPSGSYPLFENSSAYVTDKTNWVQLSGSFTATGGEQYLIIGNFRNDASTSWTNVGSGSSIYAYYYIDDVSLIPSFLPVSLIDFEGHYTGSGIRLSWETLSETNNDYFGIERSINGSLFESAGKVAGAGNSTSPHHYSYIDSPPANGSGHVYYRLKQSDFNGHAVYSRIIEVQPPQAPLTLKMIAASPGEIKIAFYAETFATLTLNITGMTGQKTSSVIIQATEGNNEQSVNTAFLVPGVYFIQLHGSSSNSGVLKFVKEK